MHILKLMGDGVMIPRAMTVDDTAKHFGVLPCTIRAWIRTGRLAATKIGKQYFIPEPEVEKALLISKPKTRVVKKISRDKSLAAMRALQQETIKSGVTASAFAAAMDDLNARNQRSMDDIRGLMGGSGS